MESVEAQNGESLTQGVIVRYIDPDANFSAQPSAAWVNPIHFVPGETPKFLVVDILSCFNHNQAMRLAKSIGYRSQSAHKLLPTTSLRGLRARGERIANIQYDNTFSGDYEIVTQVEVDALGLFCSFGCVPIDENRFILFPGEEKRKPTRKDSKTESELILDLPQNVAVTYVNGRLEATFDSPERQDVRFLFQYQSTASGPALDKLWLDFSTQMENNIAFSVPVSNSVSYFIRYKAVTNGGRSTDWEDYENVSSSVLTISGVPVSSGTVSVAFTSFTLTASGGSSPYTYTDIYERLPTGLTINSTTGVVSGIPTNAGLFSDIVIRAVDATRAAVDFPTFNINITL
jgi:hypothetical protein